jgi:ribokinase
MTHLAVVGSINMDLIIDLERLPQPGETLLGSNATYAQGGKGANQAVAAARLGASTHLIGRVGRDAFGAQIRQGLAVDGVDLSCVGETADAATGVAVIMLVHGENSIVVANGANNLVSAHDIERARAAIGQSRALLTQLEVPLTTVEYALAAGRAAGAITVLDPGPAQPCSPALLSLADYITPNQTEAHTMTGVEVTDWDSARRAAEMLLRDVRLGVIVKLGSEGALVMTQSGEVRVEGLAVPVVDTTAAGDAFCAALSLALADDMALADAARFANVVGALTVTRLGAQPSLPTLAEVRRFVAERGLAVMLPGEGQFGD